MLYFDAIEKFLLWLRIHKNYSERTIIQYERHLAKFLFFMHPNAEFFQKKKINHASVFLNIPVNNTTQEKIYSELRKYIRKIATTKVEDIKINTLDNFRLNLYNNNISTKTINAYLISIRAFFKYINKNWIANIQVSDIDLVKIEDRKVEFLNKDELKRLFSSPDLWDIKWIRDIAIMECIYSTWLRVSELVALSRKDINLKRKEFAIRWKWWKIRVVYLTDNASLLIKNYLEKRTDVYKPLFINHNFIDNWNFLDEERFRLTRFFITNMIKSYALKANIFKKTTAHTLRHSFATTLLQNWADLRSIQELLWHKNISTTQIYTHVTNPELHKIHKKFHN